MADYERPILAAEERFFNECDTENGKEQHYWLMSLWLWHNCGVPVIALLTKADSLRFPAFHHLTMKENFSQMEAMSRVDHTVAQMLGELKVKIENNLSGCKYPPKAYLSLACKLPVKL